MAQWEWELSPMRATELHFINKSPNANIALDGALQNLSECEPSGFWLAFWWLQHKFLPRRTSTVESFRGGGGRGRNVELLKFR